MQDVYPTSIIPERNFPLHLIIETTSHCNAKCKFCAHSYMKRKKGIMSIELFQKIIQEVETWDNEVHIEIIPTMFGEFFLNPHWKQYLKYISMVLPHCEISIPTNGSMLDDDAIDFIVNIPNIHYISFSVYTANDKLYHDLIGLPTSTLPRIKHAISRLNKERPDIVTRIGTTSDREFISNQKETDALVSEFGNIVDSHEITRNRAYGGYCHPTPEVVSCGSVFFSMVILWDGRVVSCCFDPEAENVLGDATKNTLLEIWNGEKRKVLCLLHTIGERSYNPLCKSCSLRLHEKGVKRL